MKNVNREDILRMVGLHGAVNLMRAINNVQLAMEEQDGKLVTYWTEIQKDEKQISLIAGRMTDAETDIAQLQVTAGQISASVSSLKTTVDGNTESIGQLQITANSLTASVSSLNTTVSGHTSKISSLELTDQSLTASVSSLNTTVSGHTSKISSLELTDQSLTASVSSLNTTVSGHTSKISSLELTDQSLTASVSSLNTTVSGHTSKIAALEITDSSISNRVTVIEGDYVKNAQISLMVVKDGNGYISNALIDADDIDFVFTKAVSWYWQSKTDANKRMGLDSSGNLWINGEYRGGTITQNVTIGTGTKKMVIEPTSTGARLVGRNGTTDVISVGFQNYGNVAPYVNINNGASGSSFAYTQMDYNSLQFGSSNNYTFKLQYNSAGRISIHGNWSSWYKDSELSSLSMGDVYVDGDGFLKVKNY